MSRALESVVAFLTGLGHEREPATAMAANLLGESIADPRVNRRYGSLKVTPDERERLAGALQSRRVLVEGALLALEGDAVREGAVLSAHALCEAREARRPITLRLGGSPAQAEQVEAARLRLIGELDSIDSLVEAALPAAVDVLQQGTGGGKAHPRVVHLQNRLNMLGHRVAADGKFGPVTTEAVKDFQAKAGMQPTGVVDEDTANALRHGRRVALVPPKVLGPAGPTAPAGMGDEQPAEIGNSASQVGVSDKQPAETTDEKVKAIPASKRVEAIVKLLKGLEGLQEAAPTPARQQRINTLRRELEEAGMPATEVAEATRACPTCGAPMRSGGKVCQRGHRVEGNGAVHAPPTKYHPWGPVQEGSNGAHYASGASELGQAEKDEMRAGRAANRTLAESAKTAGLSVTHAPIGKGGKNWITRTEPGNTGQLPAYIQNVRNAIMRGGTDESRATAIAIGRIKDWAEGKGGVHPEVRAAAAKAIAEWEALRGKSHAQSTAKRAGRAVQEADTTADFPEYLSCPACHARTLREAPTCPRGHRMDEARTLMHALVRAIRFDRDLELLLRECPELEETWAHYDAERKSGRWGKLIKEGPLPGAHTTAPTSPGRGPTGALRNFDSMSGPKLAVTLEALAVHGEDPEAHQAAMHSAGKKLGMKIHVPTQQAATLHEGHLCECGAPVRGATCQRGHRIEEAIGSIDKGAFHRWLGKGEDESITDADIARGKAAGGHPAKMAHFAEQARKWGKGK